MKPIITALIAAILLTPASSCKKHFLDLQDPNNIIADEFFKTSQEVEQAVNTLYGAANGTRENFIQNTRADDSRFIADRFASLSVYNYYNNTPQTGITDPLWDNLYTMVYRANLVLANIDKVDWTDNENKKKILEGEAYFFRGFAYFNLAYMFGLVPIVIKPAETEEEKNPAKAASIGAVYDQAIADLQQAKANLPAEQEDQGRITKGAATGFLGKTYLYRAGYLNEDANYALAANEFKEVIDMDIYHLLENYADNFTVVHENNEESLFEIEYLFNAAIETPTQNRPSHSVPGIASEIYTRPSDWLMTEMAMEKTVDNKFDQRYLETVYFSGGLPLFGVPYDDMGEGIFCENGQGQGSGDGTPTPSGYWRKYLPVNRSCFIADGQDDNNERVMRYADILLMYAEAIVKSGGSLSEAQDAVSEIRERAKLPVRTFNTSDDMMKEIMHQRVMEFSYENMRYFDMIRWGIVQQAYTEHGFPEQAANYDPVKDKYFPIPVSEINNNKNIDQNEPWK